MTIPAAILDVDGTLVDDNYQHALAWHLALRRVGVLVPVWRVHGAVGIGSDRIVAHLGGDRLEDDRGDEVREYESEIFGSMKDGVAAIEGATEFVRALNEGGRSVVLASSGDEGDIEGFLDLLEIRDDVGGWVTSADVDQTKPHPDLIEAALERAGGAPAVMVGDTNWDIEAAGRAGIGRWGSSPAASPSRCSATRGRWPSTTRWTTSAVSSPTLRWRSPGASILPSTCGGWTPLEVPTSAAGTAFDPLAPGHRSVPAGSSR